MERFYLNPDYADLLAAAGLDSFAMLNGGDPPGDVIAKEFGRSTRRLELDGKHFFLKRVYKLRPRKALEALLKLERPHHYCWREMQQIRNLQDAGIRVMEVVAAGETIRWGIPLESFILVRGVDGQPLDQVFSATGEQERPGLMQRLGVFTASLHRNGFFTPVRMKDVIRDGEGDFVLIDREARNPHPVNFTPKRASTSLYRTSYRQLRDGLHWTDDDWSAYFDGYRQAIGARWDVTEQELRRICQL